MKTFGIALLGGVACVALLNAESAEAACSPFIFNPNNANNLTCNGLSLAGANTGANNDRITHSDGGLGLLGILGPSTMGTGNDTFTLNSGFASSVDQGADNDTATVNNGTLASLVQSGGDDIFNIIAGNALTVTQGGGADEANITDGVVGSLDQGANDDNVVMLGGLLTLLNQQGGVDTLDVSGGSIVAMFQGDGDDDLTVSGTAVLLAADQGADSDTLNVNGGTVGVVFQGDDNDTANITAGTTAAVFGQDGDDEATWSGGSLLSYFGGDGSDTLRVTASSYAGTEMLDGGDDVSSGDGFTDVLTLENLSLAIDGSNLENWEQIIAETSTLTFTNNALTVGSDTDDGLFLRGGSTVDGLNAFALTGNLVISSTSTFVATGGGAGSYSISGNLRNVGTLDMRDANPGDQIFVAGNFISLGTMRMDVNTVLNTGDRLNITGNALGGPTTVVLQNTGISGSFTGDGPGAGIPLVRVTGTTTSSNFVLGGGPLIAGAFAYTLDLESDKTWYLQSEARAGAIAALAAGGMANDVGTTLLGTYHERVGEQAYNPDSNMWGRVIGSFGTAGLKASGIGEIESDFAATGLQAGIDLVGYDGGAGDRTRLGVYGGFTWLDADVSTAGAGGASGGTGGKGHVAGLYATHQAADWYVDAVLQGQWLGLDAAGGGTTMSTDAKGWLASLEAGHAFALTETATFEPQAQFIYGRSKTDAVTDSDGVNNSWSADETMLGRIGARLKSSHKLGDGEGGMVTGWLKANLWSDFSAGDTSVTMSNLATSTTTQLDGKKLWLDVGLGFDIQASQNLVLFADGGVALGLNGNYDAFNGKAGLKFRF